MGRNGDVRYSLVGDSNLLFTVDPVTGTIQTAAPLDREAQATYTLDVMATDQAHNPEDRLSTTAEVTVVLLDVNDCPPEFTSPNVTFVKEETQNGTVVFTVAATDLDAGVNSDVTFTLAQLPSLGYPFVLDRDTGHLKVNSVLRREIVANYTLTVTATDGGSPALSSTQQLTVHIQDVNNNPPVFSKNVYRETVPEDTSVGTSLLRVVATDVDEGLNGIVRYFIISGDDSYDFSLDMASGVLRLQKNLDHERVQEYTLTVRAEDSGVEKTLSSEATVFITVGDVNDFQPVFDDSPYIAYVQEGMTDVPVEVTTVTARDEDSDKDDNNKVAYQLRDVGNQVQGIFQINELSGQIMALSALDREARPMYTLTVIATDTGTPRLTGTGTLTVYVKDVNDHAPTFDSTAPYIGHVTENGGSSQSVITVTATDLDEGVNAQIMYRLEDTQRDRFTVLPSTGEILTTQSLDREESAEYHLVVIATDQGIPPKSSSCSVIIYVDDENDNSPAFEQASYSQTIMDPSDPGDFVIGVTAVDKDSGNNGKVVYSFVDGESRFHISTETGVITAAQRLSGTGTYTFQVRASDLGISPRNSTVSVTVQLRRVSGAPPSFGEFPTNVRIPENSRKGTVLTTVSAVTSRSNRVSYHIVGGNVNSALTINEDNGTITVAGLIDYEVASSLTLWLRAQDNHASDPLSSYKQLTVTVEDANDNMPRFSASLYEKSFVENQPLGTSVIRVQASDADSGTNGQIAFHIVSGNENNTFQIHPSSGLVTTHNPVVDREGIDLYNLVVEAVDQGSPPLTATSTVRVTILDLNDNPPVFSGLFSMAVPEDLPLHSLILTLTSTDKDTPANANATYQLIAGAESLPFAVDPISGNITNKLLLDAEANERYRPFVGVSDASHSVKTQIIIRLLDVNDNAPQFVSPTFAFDLREGQPEGTLVGRLMASDLDISSPNNEFYFSLKRPSILFELDAETGEIKTRTSMEYQQSIDGPSPSNIHTLDVLVTDLGMPSLSSETTVTVSITDANNHAPEFELSEYMSAVPENANRGISILTVQAHDYLDFGVNAQVKYRVSDGNGSSLFGVDEDTGEVSVRSSPSSIRAGQNYVIVVTAEDQGDPKLSANARVVLTITQTNQYRPDFRNPIMSKQIPEDAIVGFVIDTISAMDRDGPGLNGQVRYSISGGNEGGLFDIDPVRGYLKVAGELDYETQKVHVLDITARDMGLLSLNVTRRYTLTLVDVNDNSPVFNKSLYNAFVPEDSRVGAVVITMEAEDADSGNNAVVRYDIVGDAAADSMFAIHQDSGTVTVKGRLDYESRDMYTLAVMAYNPNAGTGTPVRRNVAEVRVYVTGVNEYYPRFVQKEYSHTVSESAIMNTTLVTIHATDDDKGVDGVVYYYLVGSSNLKGFALDPLTGTLRVVQRPDYESSPRIILTALAKNWGSILGNNDTDICTITITVEDANDPPVFTQDVYEAHVREGSGAATPVITVVASDNDIREENRNFQYKLEAGNEGSWFRIDANSGRIETTGLGILDRETVPAYDITVVAVDTGIPPQTGTCTVRVILDDVNDNGPVFDPPRLTVYVTEGLPPGTVVTTLDTNTSDPDAPHNRGPYTYVGVQYLDFFDIERERGLVKTRVALNREQHPEFLIPVIVSDNGVPKMSSTLTFTVVVSDVNNTPPQPRPLTVRVTVLDGMSPVGVIADVRPLDDDLEGNYSCRIVGGGSSVFSITEECALRMNVDSNQDSHQLSIAGSDGSFPEVNYNVRVELQRYDEDSLDNAVAVLLEGITSAEFLENKYVAFTNAVKGLFGLSSEAFVFSVKANGTDLFVFLSVSDERGVVSQSTLSQKLRQSTSILNSRAGVKVRDAAFQLCSASPCQHNGECVTRVAMSPGLLSNESPLLILTSSSPSLTETCLCSPAYGGDFCETAMQPCGDSYCANGGTCENNRCSCPSEWTGTYCESDVDECLGRPCQSGGTCVNTPGSFKCDCPPQFTGKFCETEFQCVSRPCLNGATCLEDLEVPEGGFRCLCAYGFFGDVCEKSSLGFNEGSYLTMPTISEFGNIVVTGHFATRSRNALLLFNPVSINSVDSGYVALEVVNGAVRFSFKLGPEPVVVEVGATNVSTGHWYRLEAQKLAQVASLVVQRCADDGSSCDACQSDDPTCYTSVPTSPLTSTIQGDILSVGGVEDLTPILQLAGAIRSHDFVGCAHSFRVNTRDILDKNRAINFTNLSDTCPRRQATSLCTATTCGSGGTCDDRWSQAACVCSDSTTGNRCETKWQPFGFGANAKVTFTTRESYRRDQMMQEVIGQTRRRRAAPESTLTLRIRTTAASGVLYHASTGSTQFVLWLEEGAVRVQVAPSSQQPITLVTNLADATWHNVALTTLGSNVTLIVNGLRNLTRSRDFGKAFDFNSIDISAMSVGGGRVLPDGQTMNGFEGCVSEFRINGAKLPLNGSSDRYEIVPTGGVSTGCAALCASNPCESGQVCSPDGETYNCSTVTAPTGPVEAGGGLEPGIIVIIVFFILLLIAIVIVFVLFRLRRSWFNRCLPTKGDNTGRKQAGGGGGGSKLVGSQNSLHSSRDSRYAENSQLEEMIIRNHIAEELAGQKTSSLTARPDLIGSNLSGVPQPTHFADGTMIIENIDQNGVTNMPGMSSEDMPEHYDLENASSIAPSDSDVIQHYQRYRQHANELKAHLNNHQHHHPHHPAHHRLYPGLGFRDGAHQRQSPVSVTGSALSMPARNSPLAVPGQSGRPSSALAALNHPYGPRDSPRVRASPLVQQLNASNSQGSRSNSAHSLGSHHSHSSSSSNPHLPNGHGPQRGKGGKAGGRYQRGLTVDEVNRLNARAELKGTASMLEAVSSSSEDPHHHHNHLHPHPHARPHLHNHLHNSHLQRLRPEENMESNVLLEPPDSSSSDSGANDSFTCSEFEYENDRGNNRLDPGTMIFSKLAEVDEDDVGSPASPAIRNGDSRNSNGDSAGSTVASDDAQVASGSGTPHHHQHQHHHAPSGPFDDFDALLNLGPSFDKFVGVFKDIALLPDSNQTIEGATGNDYEEYV
nr:hypothetical protein BaRGS_005080 [Batillaria attramentaria]